MYVEGENKVDKPRRTSGHRTNTHAQCTPTLTRGHVELFLQEAWSMANPKYHLTLICILGIYRLETEHRHQQLPRYSIDNLASE